MFLKKTLILVLISITITLGMSKTGNLPADEFARRRAIFLNELRDLNAIAILHSAPEVTRNDDVNYPYRQDSYFFYLTGWTHSNAILVLAPHNGKSEHAEVSFFVTKRKLKPEEGTSNTEIWTGPKKGLDEALNLPGIDQAIAYTDFFKYLPELSNGYERLMVSYGLDLDFQTQLGESLKKSGEAIIIQNASSLLQVQRLKKSEAEIQALEKAIEITGASLTDVFTKIPKLKYEYEVQAEIEYGFKKRGAVRLGFPSIIGAGINSTYLHYEDYQGELRSGDVLLMDVGAEWNYYTADISRTVPINGKFSPEQAQIYQLVLDAQIAAIESVKPGIDYKEKTDAVAINIITAGLVDLGLLEGDVDTLIRERTYRKFFMHGTSHWLGLDVHDAGGRVDAKGKPLKLKAGMVLTVEPGIYISESEDVDPKWWNIGIRIEDDVLVTPKGHRVLSAAIPKTISEIESIMQPR